MINKILIFGGSGLVGSRFVEANRDTLEIDSPAVEEVDILNRDQISKKFEELDPDAVINFAAYTNVEEAENQKDDENGLCFKVNVMGAKNVAEACKKFDKYLIHISTDYVFNGEKNEPYIEGDIPDPINWYGMTKYLAEQQVLASGCLSEIVRISMPYRANYEVKLDIGRFFLEQLRGGNQINTITDQKITPTFVDDIAAALSEIIKKRFDGVIHVSCISETTPFEFATTIARVFGLNESLVNGISLLEYNSTKKAKMPKNSALNPAKFNSLFPTVLHTLDESINLFKAAVENSGKIRYSYGYGR